MENPLDMVLPSISELCMIGKGKTDWSQISRVTSKSGSIASKFRYNRLIELYRSEPVRLYILEIKIDVKNSELSPVLHEGATQN